MSRAARSWRVVSVAAVVLLLVAAGCGGGDGGDGGGDVPVTAAPTTRPAGTTGPAGDGEPVASLEATEPGITVNGSEVAEGQTEAIRVGDHIVLGPGAVGFLEVGEGLEFKLFKGTDLRLVGAERLDVELFLEAGHLDLVASPDAEARVALETSAGVELRTTKRGTGFTFCQAGTGLHCAAATSGELEVTAAGVTRRYLPGQEGFVTAEFAPPAEPPSAEYCVPEDAYLQWLDGALRNEDDRTLGQLVQEYSLCEAGEANALLEADGLGGIGYGTEADATIAALTEQLGPPDDDTGWVELDNDCPHEERVVRWGGLFTNYLNAPEVDDRSYRLVRAGEVGDVYPGGPHFIRWSATEAPFATDRGVTVGTPLGDIRDGYGDDVDVFLDEGTWIAAIEGGDIWAAVDGDTDDSLVTGLFGGFLCEG